MSILSESDRVCFEWAVRQTLIEKACNPGVLTESARVDVVKNISKEITYEQALNLTFNTNRENVYVEAGLLEAIGLVKILDLLEPSLKDQFTKHKEIKLESVEDKFKVLESIISEDLKSSANEYAKGAKDIALAAKNKMKDAAEYVAKKAKDNPEIANAAKWAAAGIAASVAAWFVYKKVFSKSGNKDKANKETVKALKKAMSSCGKAKDPAKCKAKYGKEIAKWNSKAKK